MATKMETQKQIKRSEMNNHVASSSSSSEKNRTAGEINVERADGPLEKKLKMETNDVNDGQVEVEKSFDDLPAEMVMKILKQLNSKDLFLCRLVNRQWSGVASKILQSNVGVEIRFECAKFNDRIQVKGKKKMSFKTLIKCFKDSPNFPCSRLRFVQVSKLLFKHEDWIKLIANHGERIKCLILGIKEILGDSELIQLTNELRNLLLDQLPNLQQFGLQFSPTTISSKIQLFPTPSNSKTVRLPHLKVLYLHESSFTKQSGIITDILNAAINLEEIKLFRGWNGGEQDKSHASITDFPFLHSLGKLALLQCASINVIAQLLSSVKANCKTPPEFKLKELELHWHSRYINKNVWPDAAVFLSNLFESSKDTLTKLTMTSLGLLHQLQLPAFSKLTSLNVNKEEEAKFLPVGLNLMEMFPVLNFLELKLPWTIAFSNVSDLHYFPSLETLNVVGERMNSPSIAQINSMCPNLKNFKIYETSYLGEIPENFPEVGTAIWTHLTKLHSLELHIKMNSSNNHDHALDSCFTGISNQECKRLQHLFNAKKSLEQGGSQMKIPESDWKCKRENVSLLNMKDLKILTVDLDFRGRTKLDLAMSWISKDYALQLMPDLTYNIKTVSNETCYDSVTRDRSVVTHRLNVPHLHS